MFLLFRHIRLILFQGNTFPKKFQCFPILFENFQDNISLYSTIKIIIARYYRLFTMRAKAVQAVKKPRLPARFFSLDGFTWGQKLRMIFLRAEDFFQKRIPVVLHRVWLG
jgi:hypothetical protein